MPTRLSPALPSANQITTPFFSSLPTGRNSSTEVPMLRSIQRWSDQSESMLQDYFDQAAWDMFRVVSENNIDVYTDTLTEFIRKCIGDVVPTVTIKIYPNLKPWIDDSIRGKLKARIWLNTNSVFIPSVRQ
jgi:hypothetical protein